MALRQVLTQSIELTTHGLIGTRRERSVCALSEG